MTAPLSATPAEAIRRDHLEHAHHEICTALTVLGSNLELVRIELRHASLPSDGAPVQAYLGAVDEAVARLRDMAHEMKVRHGVR